MRRLIFLILTLIPLMVFSQSIPIAIPLGITLNIGLKWQGLASDSTIIDIGGDYYVATWGDDGGTGAADDPWATWKYGIDQLVAGDTLYIKGGTYIFPNDNGFGLYIDGVEDGTASELICVFNYPGEYPILDFIESAHVDRSSYYGFYLNECRHWHIKGLRVRRVGVADGDTKIGYGFSVDDCDSLIMENCVADSNRGPGINCGTSTAYVGRIWFINCDSYDNEDLATGGDTADGFGVQSNHKTSLVTYNGCRSWNNSDDGFDTWGYNGVVEYDSCWAFDIVGIGFKLGKIDSTHVDPTRYVRNCLSVNNYQPYAGNDAIAPIPRCVLYNNIGYGNSSQGFTFCTAGNPIQTFANNISYKNPTTPNNCLSVNAVTDSNSWELIGEVVTDGDFKSLDASQLYLPRNLDGSLPNVDFGQLVEGSGLVDRGFDIGIAYNGINPDVGAFESPYEAAWILGSGYWNDLGIWVDTELWTD